ncbi:XrtA/PEP-CTERM system histidine kinase PrsK [Sphingopyxis sp. PET50]|uniref:XrtA/PEP-CTERM system histidine kinase PrsK n=1 Tax=Sphingopyxis sp. PET50 TaxID=2976533 RepID=UPI0021AE983A|nr:XrtA/PEP-CTERM system histidine kinase PrsK [Sphingopyxis sp. PET50]
MGALADFSAVVAGVTFAGFAAVTLWLMLRPRARMAALMPSFGWLIAAAGGMTLWSAGIWWAGPASPEAFAARTLSNVAVLGWLSATFWNARAPMSRPLRLILRLIATQLLVAAVFAAAVWTRQGAAAGAWIGPGLSIVMMIAASGGLLLVDSGVRHASAGLRMPLLAVAGGFAMLWAYELNIGFIGVMTGTSARTLILLLPAVVLLTLPTFVLAAMDVGRERMRLSRTAATRTILLMGGASYLVLIGLAGAVARTIGGNYAELAQSLSLIVALGAGGLLLASARARAWLSVMISKHFFEHRYDYRAEWMRFTATLARTDHREGEGDGDLHRRVARALAELTGSPGALLMSPDAQGHYRVVDRWHWSADADADRALSLRSAFMLQDSGHIVDLDAVRRGATTAGGQDLAIPDWLIADTRAWVVVPVLHFQRMIAIVILHRPPVSRALDWEDLDVLRIAGRQAGSYLAESQSQAALSEAKRFDEFNRRFAFIMHDIKNLASQLALLARNAERHADKPEFRADMVETLKLSAGRLSDLLARLSPRERGRAAEAGQVMIEPLLDGIAAQMRPRRTLSVGCEVGLSAWADDASVRQIVEQLVTNAIDASADDAPVQLIAAREAGRVRIDILDQGEGMSREFIRDGLFKPFVSTKEGGFGLGAFEALQLAQAIGGAIDVTSEPGEGSRFTLWLPAAGEDWMKVA